MIFLRTRKYIRQEMGKLLRQNEYLKSEKLRYKEREQGYLELIKIYEAVIIYLGENLKETYGFKGTNFDKRVSEILALLKKDGK